MTLRPIRSMPAGQFGEVVLDDGAAFGVIVVDGAATLVAYSPVMMVRTAAQATPGQLLELADVLRDAAASIGDALA